MKYEGAAGSRSQRSWSTSPACNECAPVSRSGHQVAVRFGRPATTSQTKCVWSTGCSFWSSVVSKEKEMFHDRRRRLVCAFAVASALLIPVLPARAQTPADNTKVNQRDRAKDATTADQQKESAADREITQKIRRALMDDKTLSTYAHNVKIITQDGHVTLKGPVQTAEEKKTVEAKASEVAGDGHVTNQLSIAPSKGSN